MKNQAQFDYMIKDALVRKAQSKEVVGGMADRVKEKIINDSRKGKIYRLIRNNGWRKVSAVVASILVLAIIGAFSLSSDMKVWAKDTVTKVVNTIQVTFHETPSTFSYSKEGENTVKTENGETTSIYVSERGYLAKELPNTRVDELDNAAGFKVSLPAYLPDGYKVPEKAFVENQQIKFNMDKSIMTSGKNSDSSNIDGVVVKIRFDGGNEEFKGLKLMVYNTDIMHLLNSKGINIKIADKDALWSETELNLTNDSSKQNSTVIENTFSWKDGGLYYSLTDYSGLSKDEMIKIAESIIK